MLNLLKSPFGPALGRLASVGAIANVIGCSTPEDIVDADSGRDASNEVRVVDAKPGLDDLRANDIANEMAASMGGEASAEDVAVESSGALDATMDTSPSRDDVIDASVPPLGAEDVADVSSDALDATVDTSPLRDDVIEGSVPPLGALTVDLPTVASDGVLLIRADFVDRSAIEAIRIGTSEIPATDPFYFRWPPYAEARFEHVFAVRVPSGLALGPTDLVLIAATGRSAVASVELVSAAPLVPPPPGAIVFSPGSAADDTFPFGTQATFGEEDIAAMTPANQVPDGPWWYHFTINDSGLQNMRCNGDGTIAGIEWFCPPSCSDPTCKAMCHSSVTGSPGTTGAKVHTIQGTYAMTGARNFVDVNIDRTSSSGIVEHYLGGWVNADGSSPTSGKRPYLVLRSQRTGLQMTIKHGIKTPLCYP